VARHEAIEIRTRNEVPPSVPLAQLGQVLRDLESQ
jgi:hypothetical protein